MPPKKISPMLATLVEEPFDRKGWLFEIKWDEYRAIAHKSRSVELISRGEKSFNARFPTIVKALEKVTGTFILDGEIVILDDEGRSNFQLLQNYYQKRKAGTPYYYVFDILAFNGKDLTSLPLIQRKQILKKILGKSRLSPIKFGDHILKNGKAFFKAAKKSGLEGIIAKKSLSPYQFHRSRDWLKIKTGHRQEFVIGGFTQPKGSRSHFGALLVGVYDKGKLIYAGHVGGGFNQMLLDDVYTRLQKLITTKCPFADKPNPNAPVTWVKPKLVCEVAFAEWTKDNILRQPIFKGMRVDKSPKEVVRETPK